MCLASVCVCVSVYVCLCVAVNPYAAYYRRRVLHLLESQAAVERHEETPARCPTD